MLVTELVSQLLTSGLKYVGLYGVGPQFPVVQRSNWYMLVTPDVQLFDRPSLSGGKVPASACRRTSEARSARVRESGHANARGTRSTTHLQLSEIALGVRDPVHDARREVGRVWAPHRDAVGVQVEV